MALERDLGQSGRMASVDVTERAMLSTAVPSLNLRDQRRRQESALRSQPFTYQLARHDDHSAFMRATTKRRLTVFVI